MKWLSLDLSSMECRKRQFPSVDIMKLFCAILVISSHTNPLLGVNKYLNYGLVQYVARLGVPFFFIASGYFCFRKTTYQNFNPRIPFEYAKKIFRLYIVWTGIYFPQICYNIYIDEKGIKSGIINNMRNLIFVGHHHLWYLLSTVVAVLIITFVLRKGLPIEKIVAYGAVLYIVGLLGQSYFEILRPLENTILWEALKLYANVFETTRNGFFEGILFVGTGALLAYKRIEIRKGTAILGLLVSMIALLLEAFFVKYFELARQLDLYIMLAPAAFFMFYVVSHVEMRMTIFSKEARTYSSLLYFTHSWINFPIVSVINIIFQKCTGVEMHSLLRFFTVLAGSVVTSYVIIKLQNYPLFRWLRKVY